MSQDRPTLQPTRNTERPARPTAGGVNRPSAPRLRRKPPRQAAPPPLIPEREPAPDYLLIGHITGAHGLRGECRLRLVTNHPDSLREIATLYFGDEHEPYAVRRIHLLPGGKEAILRLQTVTSPEAAIELRGTSIWAAQADLPPLPAGELYHYQLLGLDVQTEAGTPLGRLAEIIETGANDVYVVRGVAGEQLFPAIESVIIQVDLDAGIMTVRPQEYYSAE